jgi:hypothetical protein
MNGYFYQDFSCKVIVRKGNIDCPRGVRFAATKTKEDLRGHEQGPP